MDGVRPANESQRTTYSGSTLTGHTVGIARPPGAGGRRGSVRKGNGHRTVGIGHTLPASSSDSAVSVTWYDDRFVEGSLLSPHFPDEMLIW